MHFNPNKCILPINQVMYSRCIELQVLYYISLKSDKFHTHSKTSSTAKRDILYALKNGSSDISSDAAVVQCI